MLNSDVADLYATSPVLFAGSVFVLGLVIGSFLNVVIYRLPIMLEREWRAQAAEILPLGRRATRDHTRWLASHGRARERFTLSRSPFRLSRTAKRRSPPGKTSP